MTTERDEATHGVADRPVIVSVLGHLHVTVDGHAIELTAEKERIVLATLAVSGQEGISVEALMDELWDEPTSANKGTLQTYVSNLRRALRTDTSGGPVIERVGDRYRLSSDVAVDLDRFRMRLAAVREALASEATRGDASDLVAGALAVVRGPLDPTLVRGAGLLAAEAARANEEWREARWIRAELEIQADRAAGVVSDLLAVVEEDPTEERFWRLLMLAYWRTGRQQMALDAYQQVRRVLADELGVLPDPSLQDLEQAILRHDPELARQPDAAAPVPKPRGHIRAVRTTFVGRSQDLALVDRLVDEHPVVTLRGAGGCGKTRLALEAARIAQDRFAHGAWWVELVSVPEPAEGSARAAVVDAIATAVGLIRRGQGSLDDALLDHLSTHESLLVLDNCEHLIADVAAVVADIIDACPQVRVLCTTRESLRLAGEVAVAVGPLPLEHDSDDPTPAAVLFLDRADPAGTVIERTQETMAVVEEICRRLDGVPLAIELAAALAETTPLADLLDELGQNRFEVLTVGARGAIRHHQTLEAVVDWSYDRLDPDQQDLFATVSAFAGSFSLGAATAVAAGDGTTVKPILDSLVRKSIVETVRTGRGVERYRLLETLRQYGLARLAERGHRDEDERRFIAYFATLAERKAYDPTTSVVAWFEELGPDIPNLRRAISRAMATGAVDEALSMIDSFHWYYNHVGSLTQAEQWLRELVDPRNEAALTERQRVMAYTSLASLAQLKGSFRETGDWADLAVEAARSHGDVHRRMAALVVRGATAVFEGRQDVALEAFAESLELSEELGDRWGRAAALMFLAVGQRRAADEQRRADPSSPWLTRLNQIGRDFERSYELFSQVGDDRGMALVMINLGRIEEHKGDLPRAVLLCDRGLHLAERNGDAMTSGLARLFRARMAVEQGDDGLAVECFVKAAEYGEALEFHRVLFSSAVEWLGIIAARHGASETLLRIAAATEVHRAAPRTAAALPELYAEQDRARAELGFERSADLESDGRLMSPAMVKELAVAAARAALGATPG